jgi:hypothetical protein
MFYARLRDIGDELRKFRIAFDFADERHIRTAPHHDQRSAASWPEPPKPLTPPGEDVK